MKLSSERLSNELEGADAGAIEASAEGLLERLEAGPEDVDTALVRLVLMLVEFIRQVLERQAIRRMEGGSLTEEEVERLGLTLMRLSERMEDLKKLFGLDDRDLRLDIGPIGRVL